MARRLNGHDAGGVAPPHSGQGAGAVVPPHGGVTPEARLPMYQQIALILRDEILSGARKLGEMLPSEAELCRRYGVSRITARQSLDTLARQRLVRRLRGKGTVVERVAYLPPLRASVSKWLDSARVMGLSTDVRILDVATGAATVEESQALRLDEGAPVLRALRVRLANGAPFSHLRTVLPGEVAEGIDIGDLERLSLLQILVRAGHAISHAEQTVTAALANQATAAALETEAGSALLKIQRIVYAAGDRPIEYLTAFYRPDRYQLEMVLDSDQEILRIGNTGDGSGIW